MRLENFIFVPPPTPHLVGIRLFLCNAVVEFVHLMFISLMVAFSSREGLLEFLAFH